MMSTDFYSAGWCLFSISEGTRGQLDLVMQERNASSFKDWLGQEAHILGLCLNKH